MKIIKSKRQVESKELVRQTIILVVIRVVEAGELIQTIKERFTRGDQLESFWRKMKTQYPSGEFYLVNCTHPTPAPADFSQSELIWWCPYCARSRHFYLDEQFDLRRCNICNISESDYYVRRYNRIPDIKHHRERP